MLGGGVVCVVFFFAVAAGRLLQEYHVYIHVQAYVYTIVNGIDVDGKLFW